MIFAVKSRFTWKTLNAIFEPCRLALRELSTTAVLKGTSLVAVHRMFHMEEASIRKMSIHFSYPLMSQFFSNSALLIIYCFIYSKITKKLLVAPFCATVNLA